MEDQPRKCEEGSCEKKAVVVLRVWDPISTQNMAVCRSHRDKLERMFPAHHETVALLDQPTVEPYLTKSGVVEI